MAVKDTEPYLPDCLDSIVNQTHPHWELIAVNDHSSDRSREILANYAQKDARIRLFDSEGERLIPALQTGYKHVKGDLINRMDSDDKMPHDKLETMVKAWKPLGMGHVVAGGTEHFVDEGEVGDGFLRYEDWLNDVARRGAHYEEIYQECTIPSHCWLMHKTDFDRAGAFDSDIYPEDYDLTFRLYRHGLEIVGMDKILHYWRDRSNRISRTWDEYKDNRYFELKLSNFYDLDRDRNRPLVIWGAGRNGKDLAKLVLENEKSFNWVCDNDQKIGKDIYDIRMEHFDQIPAMNRPQIIIAVSSPDARLEIKKQLQSWGKRPVEDYWFFC